MIQIDPSKIDEKLFNITMTDMYGEPLFLITPKDFVKIPWNQHNAIFRSSMWDMEGNIVSAGLPKFENLGEGDNALAFHWGSAASGYNPYLKGYAPIFDFCPPELTAPEWKKSFFKTPIIAEEKLDGTCLIVSSFKGKLIIRTRGRPDCSEMENAFEIEDFIKKWPEFFKADGEHFKGRTYIFEWVSPLNQIVVPYKDSNIILTKVIEHDHYSINIKAVRETASKFGFNTPRTWAFADVNNLVNNVNDLDYFGIKESLFEGFVIIFGGFENVYGRPYHRMVKIKNADYLRCHAFRSDCNLETVMDIILDNEIKTFAEAMKHIEVRLDYECAQMAMPHISRIVGAMGEVASIIEHMKVVATEAAALPSRKAAAEMILAKYGNTNRASYVFTILDGKAIPKDGIKKLFFQVLKK